jgi:preprotein translocase subunit SecA
MREQTIDELVRESIPEKAYPEQWDTARLQEQVQRVLGLDLPVAEWAQEEGIADEEIRKRLHEASEAHLKRKEATYGAEVWRNVEKSLLLQVLDHLWKEHLLHLDYLRQGIYLRGFGQRDPLNEYKREAFDLFEAMLGNLRREVTRFVSTVELRLAEPEPPAPPPPPRRLTPDRLREIAPALSAAGGVAVLSEPEIDPARPETWARTPRNAPCPCGSGRKYKYCHGKLA